MNFILSYYELKRLISNNPLHNGRSYSEILTARFRDKKFNILTGPQDIHEWSPVMFWSIAGLIIGECFDRVNLLEPLSIYYTRKNVDKYNEGGSTFLQCDRFMYAFGMSVLRYDYFLNEYAHNTNFLGVINNLHKAMGELAFKKREKLNLDESLIRLTFGPELLDVLSEITEFKMDQRDFITMSVASNNDFATLKASGFSGLVHVKFIENALKPRFFQHILVEFVRTHMSQYVRATLNILVACIYQTLNWNISQEKLEPLKMRLVQILGYMLAMLKTLRIMDEYNSQYHIYDIVASEQDQMKLLEPLSHNFTYTAKVFKRNQQEPVKEWRIFPIEAHPLSILKSCSNTNNSAKKLKTPPLQFLSF